jgi:hypothetical protein
MTRRMILGRRGGEYGLWVSPAGVDAASVNDASALFSMGVKHLMAVAAGSFVCPAGGAQIRVSFGKAFPVVPFLFCGHLVEFPTFATVYSVVDHSGFYATPGQSVQNPGTFPAAGSVIQWFAFMKNQG